MESVFDGKGLVEIVFARGWISAWEAERLEKGCVVVGDTEAGQSAELTFEGRWLARGEIVVLGDKPGLPLVGLRLSGLDKEAREAPERERGQGLTQLLPFELCLGQASYSLSELSEATAGSIVSLDSPLEAPAPILLRIAGKPAARGRAAVVGEGLAIYLDEVPDGSRREAEPFATGALIGTGGSGRRIKLYDFQKPDRFTMRTIKALESIHRRIGEVLAARDPRFEGQSVTCVDQLTWGEWLDEGGNSGKAVQRTVMSRPGRSYAKDEVPRCTGRPFIEPGNAKQGLPAAVGDRIERWTAMEETRLGDFAVFMAPTGGTAQIPESDLLAAMRAGWQLVTDAMFSPAENLALPPVLRPSADRMTFEGDSKGLLRDEMIALVRFEGEGGGLDIVYSARALYSHTKALDRYARHDVGR